MSNHIGVGAHVHLYNDTEIGVEPYNDEHGRRGTIRFGFGGTADCTLFMQAPDIDRLITALEDLRDKVAALARKERDDA